VNSFTDLQLKSAIVTLLPYISYSLLLAVGERMVELLEAQKGKLSTAQIKSTISFLNAAAATESSDFVGTCISIHEKTRHPLIARKAKEAIRDLLPD
jgi:hypothetical protein